MLEKAKDAGLSTTANSKLILSKHSMSISRVYQMMRLYHTGFRYQPKVNLDSEHFSDCLVRLSDCYVKSYLRCVIPEVVVTFVVVK